MYQKIYLGLLRFYKHAVPIELKLKTFGKYNSKK